VGTGFIWLRIWIPIQVPLSIGMTFRVSKTILENSLNRRGIGGLSKGTQLL
jgi:hypothetical protein